MVGAFSVRRRSREGQARRLLRKQIGRLCRYDRDVARPRAGRRCGGQARLLLRQPTEGDAAEGLRLWDESAGERILEAGLSRTSSIRNCEFPVRTRRGDMLDCLVWAETVTIHGQACVLSVPQDITKRSRSEGVLVSAIEAGMHDKSCSANLGTRSQFRWHQARVATREDCQPEAALPPLPERERPVGCQGSGDQGGRGLPLVPEGALAVHEGRSRLSQVRVRRGDRHPTPSVPLQGGRVRSRVQRHVRRWDRTNAVL